MINRPAQFRSPFARVFAVGALCAMISGLSAAPAAGQLIKKSLPEIEGVGIVDRRGAEIPKDLTFTDAKGRPIRSSEFFDGKRPVILVMAYYDCPLLCTLVLNATQEALNGMNWTAGEEFRVVTVSFDHTNTTQIALERQVSYLAGYGRECPEDAWMFLTSDAANARALADAIGFNYRFISESGEFSHPAAMFFVTPKGQLNNFIENIEYDPRDVKLALMDASEGKVGTIFDRIQHLCFVYDPDSGGYVLAMNMMRIGGLLTMLALGTFVTVVVWKAKRREFERHAAELQSASGASHAGGTL